MPVPSRALPFLAVVLACVAVDQAVKAVATAILAEAPPVWLAGGLVHFELAHNPGAFMSLGATWSPALRTWLLQGLVPLGLVALSVWVVRAPDLGRGQQIALGLLVGGGLGNSIDRLASGGYVTDFVSLGIGPLRTGIFNVADLAVVVGVLLFALAPTREEPRPSVATGDASDAPPA